ncbi:MAG: alpha-ketoglutarate-dependent dioxygenase AlkB [Bacteroidetes bacterium]|nr:alpha-ketoglutarate-dependent dioxygenase AlkB [Bacteroidota bacterium]
MINNLLSQHGELYLLPNFLNAEDADIAYELLLQNIKWKQYHIKMFGKLLAQPRLTAWHGSAGLNYSYSGLNLAPEPFSKELLTLKAKIEQVGSIQFNSVLLNLYRNERDSMGWHADDERELGINPVIASLSLGQTRKFQVKHKLNKDLNLNLLLTHGSLLLMKGEMQHYWQHAIPKSKNSCSQRINLTFRNILVK